MTVASGGEGKDGGEPARSHDDVAEEPSGRTAGLEYARLISEQLEEEAERKASIQARSAAVVTSTSVIVTVMFSVAAIVSKDESFVIPGVSKVALGLALVSFSVAAVSAIIVAWPSEYWAPDPADLKSYAVIEAAGPRWAGEGTPGSTQLRESVWVGDASIGERRVAEMRANMIISARLQTGKKAIWLIVGMVAQAITVVLLAFAVMMMIFWQPTSPTGTCHSGHAKDRPEASGHDRNESSGPRCRGKQERDGHGRGHDCFDPPGPPVSPTPPSTTPTTLTPPTTPTTSTTQVPTTPTAMGELPRGG